MLAATLLLLSVALTPARAAAADAGPSDEFSAEVDAYSRKLAALPPAPAECRAAYEKVDAADPLRIGVFFGFIDTARKNYVADGDFKRALLARLTLPCRGSLQACGFAAAANAEAGPNQTRLRKTVDGRQVVLDVFNSSLGADYHADVRTLGDRQAARSRLAEAQYLAALGSDAVVLYAGHTRRFSGTGFFPPLDFTKTSAVSLLRRPFYLSVYDALRGAAAPPAVMGLFACHSSQYYGGGLHAASPGTALILSSHSSGHENNLLSLYGALNAVLARPCYADAVASINADGAPLFGVYGLPGQPGHPRYVRFQDGRVVLLGLLLIPFFVAFASKRASAGEAAWPERAPREAWRELGLMLALLAPCALVVRAFSGEMVSLPLLLSLLGFSGLAVLLAKGRLSAAPLARAARRAWPAAALFLLLYLISNLAREASADNALSALRQAATFALVVAALWPFALFSEDALLGPFVGEGGPGFVPACLHALVFYLAVWLALCWLAPVYKPRLWPLAALALYGRVLSFALHRRQRGLAAAALAQALTLALLVTEGLHALIYY